MSRAVNKVGKACSPSTCQCILRGRRLAKQGRFVTWSGTPTPAIISGRCSLENPSPPNTSTSDPPAKQQNRPLIASARSRRKKSLKKISNDNFHAADTTLAITIISIAAGIAALIIAPIDWPTHWPGTPYAALLVNTYFSVMHFSNIVPADIPSQRIIDGVLTVFYLALAATLGNALLVSLNRPSSSRSPRSNTSPRSRASHGQSVSTGRSK